MKNKKKYLGICYIILAAFFFALMAMFVRLSGDIPSIQKSFFRNLVSFVFAGIILIKKNVWFSGKRENVKYLLMRSVAGTLGILCNFYAVDHMVLSDASMLNKMSPFFAIICSYFLLKEKVTIPQTIIVAGAFLGSLLIIKPTAAIFNSPAALIGLLGGLGAGVAYTYVRVLGKNGKRPVCCFCIFGIFLYCDTAVFDFRFSSDVENAVAVSASGWIVGSGRTVQYYGGIFPCACKRNLGIRLFADFVFRNTWICCVRTIAGYFELAGLCDHLLYGSRHVFV